MKVVNPVLEKIPVAWEGIMTHMKEVYPGEAYYSVVRMPLDGVVGFSHGWPLPRQDLSCTHALHLGSAAHRPGYRV